MVGIEQYIIGNVAFAHGELLLDDGVAPLTDVERGAVVNHRAYVAVERRGIGKGEQAVEPCYLVGIDLYGRDIFVECKDEVVVEAVLESRYLVLGTKDLLFILLQFLRDVALGIDERLLAYPGLGHLVLVCVAYLDVVTEDVVESNLEAGYLGSFALALLHLQEVVLARIGDTA